MKEPYVFISYSRKDGDFVRALTRDLESSGVKVWVDVNNISPGQNWQSEIKGSIQSASAFLYVASASSVQSQYILAESKLVLRSGALVIPIIIDDIGAHELPQGFREFQWVDFRSDYQSALGLLISTLPKKILRNKPVKTEKQKSKGYVFLSYAEEDYKFAESLKDFLKNRGYGYWDYNDSDRNYHTLLFLELEGVIREASATLSILSPDWKQSKWAVKEFYFSEEVGTPVFLILAREMGPTLATAGMMHIDFVKDLALGFLRLDRELKRKGL